MVRIIPWSLPEVKGGSIGGYTPKVDPTPPTPEPEPKTEYFDFDNVDWNPTLIRATFPTVNLPAKGSKELTSVSSLTFTPSSISGIEVVDLTGVSSMKMYIRGTSHAVYGTNEWIISVPVDIITFGITPNMSGTITIGTTKTSADSFDTGYLIGTGWTTDTLSIQFVVYNGNGEVLQQTEEIVLVGGE